jgi:hypothetical protein
VIAGGSCGALVQLGELRFPRLGDLAVVGYSSSTRVVSAATNW